MTVTSSSSCNIYTRGRSMARERSLRRVGKMDEIPSLCLFLLFSTVALVRAAPLSSCSAQFEAILTTLNSSAVHFPLHHRQSPCSRPPPLNPELPFSLLLLHDDRRVSYLARRLVSGGPVSLPLAQGASLGVGNYVARILVGSPAKPFSVIVDTGSSLSWLQCLPCKISCHAQAGALFDPEASSTYARVPCSASACSALSSATLNPSSCTRYGDCVYAATYGDASFSVGYLSQVRTSLPEMGCVSSKNITRSSSFREEVQQRLQRRKTDSYEEMVTTDQFVAALCSNTVPNKLKGHELSNQPSVTKEQKSKAKIFAETQEPESNVVEIINTWELLAGLEDDNEDEVKNEELSKSLNPTKDDSETIGEARKGELKDVSGQKGLRRRVMAEELTNVKVPKFEFSRTGSLRDWLSQGGQVFSPGSYVTPKFGSFEPASANGGDEGSEKVAFDPNLVAQLEEAIEEMAIEQDEILRKIM